MNRAPESWSVRITDANVAQLTIPGALNRTRVFDIDTQLLARIPEGARLCELGLSLEIDGARQWSRTIAGSTPGEAESLEYHCRVTVGPGRDVRLRVRAVTKHCALQALSLSATEELGS